MIVVIRGQNQSDRAHHVQAAYEALNGSGLELTEAAEVSSKPC